VGVSEDEKRLKSRAALHFFYGLNRHLKAQIPSLKMVVEKSKNKCRATEGQRSVNKKTQDSFNLILSCVLGINEPSEKS
jgi:hypothetical protein